jgi:catechol 2,3-dioxygenase-like lactoylglutathione lyase family enzyme/ferredoxin
MKTLKGARHSQLADFTPTERESFPQAAFKWVLSNPDVSGLVVTISTYDQLDEYLVASGQPVTTADVDVLEKYDRLVANDYCRPGCGDCLDRCPHGVPVNDVLRYQMYAENYGFEKEAMRLYAGLEPAHRADRCLGCPAPCEAGCRFGLPIRQKLIRGAPPASVLGRDGAGDQDVAGGSFVPGRPLVTIRAGSPDDGGVTMTTVRLEGLNHVGIRIRDLARSVEWYSHLGFRLIWQSPPHKVACLRNEAIGMELNFIFNSDDSNGGKNVLMDIEPRYPGFNHLSFRVSSIADTISALEAAGIEISEGPVALGGEIAVFVRDPDLNVVELAEITPER